MLQAEPADPGMNIEEVNTMIKKWIENTEEVRQRLTQMLMDDASEMCRYQRDIYMYIDEDGQARLDWFVNVGGYSWIDDDHFLLYRCREHYDDIFDSIDGIPHLADILEISSPQSLILYVSRSLDISPDEVDFSDCCRYASDNCMDTVRAWYEQSIEDAASDYADQADEIMRAFCRESIDHAGWIEDITDTVPIVWLFVIDFNDQRALDKQRGGESNG